MNLEEWYLHIEWFGNYNYSIRYVPIYPVLWTTKTEFRRLTELLHLLLEYSKSFICHCFGYSKKN